MAPNIILFTYDLSVFGRKTDWYFTLRGLQYSRCLQRNRLPRPDLEALGVKYRRIPIMAIGKDIYCDSRIIFDKLEQLFPENTLGANTPFEKSIEYLLENWVIDGGPFWKTAGLIPPSAAVMNDEKWLDDRREMTGGNFTKANLAEARPESLAHSRMYFTMIENSLIGDGRQYVLDTPEPRLADLHILWLLDWTMQDNQNMLEALEKDVISRELFPKTFAWVDRFREVIAATQKKNGNADTIPGDKAIEQILSSDFFEKEGEVDPHDPLKLKKGQLVEVWPTESGMNHHDKGELVALSVKEVVILSQVPGGKAYVRIHFPRTNFRIRAVQDARL